MTQSRLLFAASAALLLVAAAPAHAQLAGKKVLIVNSYHEGYAWSDGEEKSARLVLEGAGFTVAEAAGGEEALSEVTERNLAVGLLLTDVVMPRMGGKELAQRLRQRLPGVKVLYTSGYTADVISHHGILETGLDYLEKPFSSLDLLKKVREILDRRDGP